MLAFELDFFPRAEARGDELGQFDDALETFLVELHRNGNILFDWHLLEFAGRVQARVLVPEEVALNAVHLSPNGLEDASRLRALSAREPEFRVVPEARHSDEWCVCGEPSCYVLFSVLRGHESDSPVECGDCARPVPLYKIPRVGTTESEQQAHFAIRGWEHLYRALDTVFLCSSIGERFAYRHLSSPRSELMRQTRQLASQLEVKAGKPFYAFLQQWHEQWGDNCPMCGRRWTLDEPWNTRYAFKCEHSRLVSEEAYQDPTPLRELHP
jgi:predicted  nucleic acid-binding Zn ribbon protein